MYTISIENLNGAITQADPTETQGKAIERARRIADWKNDYRRIFVQKHTEKGTFRVKTLLNKEHCTPADPADS